MILPTGVVIIQGSGRGDPIKIGPDLIPLEHDEWFKQNLRHQYVTFRGHVYLIDGDIDLGGDERILYLHHRPEFDTPDLAVSELLVPFILDVLSS